MSTGVNVTDLIYCVIEPTLRYINLHSKAAVQLIAGTAAVESRMGHFLKQRKGPALGIYQIEPATHLDVCNYLSVRQPSKKYRIDKLKAVYPSDFDQQLITNLMYATAITRMIYFRIPEPLPHLDDIHGMASYWKRYYNTELGAGTVEHFMQCYRRYCE